MMDFLFKKFSVHSAVIRKKVFSADVVKSLKHHRLLIIESLMGYSSCEF